MPNHHKIARSTRKSVCAARQAIHTNTSRAQSHAPRVANRSPRKPFSTSAKLTRCFGDSDAQHGRSCSSNAAHVANALAGRRKNPPAQPVFRHGFCCPAVPRKRFRISRARQSMPPPFRLLPITAPILRGLPITPPCRAHLPPIREKGFRKTNKATCEYASCFTKTGGANRSRTDLEGFAVLCLTAWLSRLKTPMMIAKRFSDCKRYFSLPRDFPAGAPFTCSTAHRASPPGAGVSPRRAFTHFHKQLTADAGKVHRKKRRAVHNRPCPKSFPAEENKLML